MTGQTRRTLLEVAPEYCVACGDDLGMLIIANGLRLLGPGATGTPAHVGLGVPAPVGAAR